MRFWILLICCVWSVFAYQWIPASSLRSRHSLAYRDRPSALPLFTREHSRVVDAQAIVRSTAKRSKEIWEYIISVPKLLKKMAQFAISKTSGKINSAKFSMRDHHIVETGKTIERDLKQFKSNKQLSSHVESNHVESNHVESNPVVKPLEFINKIIDRSLDKFRMSSGQKIGSLNSTIIGGKRVFLKSTFFDPQSQSIPPFDDWNTDSSLSTITFLAQNKAKVIIMTHFGSPKSKSYDEQYTLESLAGKLSSRISLPVKFVGDCFGLEVEKAINNLQDGEILLLENWAFYSPEFCSGAFLEESLTRLEDYVDIIVKDDTLSSTSITPVSSFLNRMNHISSALNVSNPIQFIGFDLEKELELRNHVTSESRSKLVLMLGDNAASLSIRLQTLGNWISRSDRIILGGELALLFAISRGMNLTSQSNKEMFSPSLIQEAQFIDKIASSRGCKFILPCDFATLCPSSDSNLVENIVDWGNNTQQLVIKSLEGASTVIWDGFLAPSCSSKSTNITFVNTDDKIAGYLSSMVYDGAASLNSSNKTRCILCGKKMANINFTWLNNKGIQVASPNFLSSWEKEKKSIVVL